MGKSNKYIGVSARYKIPILNGLFWVLLVLVGAYVFYKRYPFNLTKANFYAEDGKIFAFNVINKGVISATFSLFNGYLIVLQYGVTDLGFLINNIFGSGFSSLPKGFAVSSYLTLSMAASLPWLLFRRNIGWFWSLIAVLLLLFVPLGGSDYAVIGTIGNLKFVFFFVAAMLVIYRNQNRVAMGSLPKLVFIDLLLLLCVFTNILVVAILPIALCSYRTNFKQLLDRRKVSAVKVPVGLISLIVALTISVLYLVIVYIHGIPRIEGYLQDPLHADGFINALFRSTWYGIVYPSYTTLNLYLVVGLLVFTPIIAFKRSSRVVELTVLWAVAVSTIGFVANRPGVTIFLLGYNSDGGPGQFFYGASMLFVFGLVYLLAVITKDRLTVKNYILVSYLVALYLIWSIPYTGFGAKSYSSYAARPTLKQALAHACGTESTSKNVVIEIYPSESWKLTMSKELACKK